MTGMRILGNISTGVRNAANVPPIAINIAMTIKVSGRLSAILTIPIINNSNANRLGAGPT